MMMERHEIIGLMAELKLAGMRHAYDEVIADVTKVGTRTSMCKDGVE